MANGSKSLTGLPKQIKASVRKVIFKSSNDDGYYILGMRLLDPPEVNGDIFITATGNFPEVHEDDVFEGKGTWSIRESEKYGDSYQFRFTELVYDDMGEMDRETFVSFVAANKFNNVGPAYADAIYTAFDGKVIDALDNGGKSEFADKAESIKGIGRATLLDFYDRWQVLKNVRASLSFLNKLGVASGTAMKIVNKYGAAARKTVEEHPYQLYRDIDGIGFVKADEIAMKVGVKKYDVERIEAVVYYVTTSKCESEGHTKFVRKELLEAVSIFCQSELGLNAYKCHDVIMDAYHELCDVKVLYEFKEDGVKYVSKGSSYYSEYSSADNLLRLKGVTSIDGGEVDGILKEWSETDGITLDPIQHEAVVTAMLNKVSVITGGAGTGKTTIQRAILAVAKKLKLNVMLAAPTGKAAARMPVVDGRKASTIHRLLEFNPAFGFGRTRSNKLSGDLFIVDECSMVDSSLAGHLLEAVPDSAQVIMIGDVDQLPSVGAGNVLYDVIHSGVFPVTRLRRVFRQADGNDIAEFAAAVNSGEPVDYETVAGNYHIVRFNDDYHLSEGISDLYKGGLREIVGDFSFDNVQLLCPKRKKSGELNTDELNTKLQAMLNPQPPESVMKVGKSLHYGVGDRVMQLKNDYNLNVFNGDQGIVIDINGKDKTMLVDFGDDAPRLYKYKNIVENLSLAYACTVHKSQGNEYPIVIVVLGKEHTIMLNRNLAYTAVTRAKKHVVVMCTGDKLNYAITNPCDPRSTLLRNMLVSLDSYENPYGKVHDSVKEDDLPF